MAKKKSSKNPAKYRTGDRVLLFKTVSYLRAQDITFENSFNIYMATEEVDDGVEYTGETIIVERKLSTYVKAKTSTERGASIAIESTYNEFLNCRFYNSEIHFILEIQLF